MYVDSESLRMIIRESLEASLIKETIPSGGPSIGAQGYRAEYGLWRQYKRQMVNIFHPTQGSIISALKYVLTSPLALTFITFVFGNELADLYRYITGRFEEIFQNTVAAIEEYNATDKGYEKNIELVIDALKEDLLDMTSDLEWLKEAETLEEVFIGMEEVFKVEGLSESYMEWVAKHEGTEGFDGSMQEAFLTLKNFILPGFFGSALSRSRDYFVNVLDKTGADRVSKFLDGIIDTLLPDILKDK
tara:strand:+ start:4716 stop:5453 length:738 start_codon:yes stop_codon:yes gene_type:complete